MNVLRSLALILFCAAVAFCQQPAKINLLMYFDKVTPPPLTAQKAYEQCTDPKHPGNRDAENLFKPLKDELIKIETAISTAQESPNMGGSMSAEPQSVMDAIKEYGKVVELQSQGYSQIGAEVQAKAKYDQDLESRHKSVDDWRDQAIKKLPLHEEGESGSAADPKAVYEIRINAFRKHLAIVDEHLNTVGKAWAKEKVRSKSRYPAYESALEKTHYGADAVNGLIRVQLSAGQVMIIDAITKLIDDSQKAYEYASEWYEQMVQFEKQNKQ